MRLNLILPRVEPADVKVPEACPVCGSKHLRLHQEVEKPLRDTLHPRVKAYRYRCLKCEATHRVYPRGVSRAHTSTRIRGLAVMLYLLGLSYGAVALVMEALGAPLSKSRVYDVVQEAARRVPGMKREAVFTGVRVSALGADVTSVRCAGKWLPLGLSVDGTKGLVLTVDGLDGEDAQTLERWIAPIVTKVGAELLITDDADAFKKVADNQGLMHQVCKSHVQRNTDALIANLKPLAATDSDGSLAAIGVSPEQAVADLERLGELIRSRQPEQEDELGMMYGRYMAAAPPRENEQASIAYRVRCLMLDRWNLWRRLTRYRTWKGPEGERIDGTNNHAERAIGWWVKERYRTMRGYKKAANAVNVSRLLAWCGNHLNSGGVDLEALVA
jgi:transposase-like protein